MPLAPSSGFAAFQSPHPSAYEFLGFRAPPPPSTACLSTLHQPISQASSSNEEEGVPTYYEAHCMIYFNLYSMNNNEEMRYLWIISADISKEGIHILVEFESIEQQNIPITHDMNTTSLPEHITAVTQMVSDEPSMLYSAVNNEDDEVDGSDGDEAVSGQSESDDDNEPEEGEFQTPINPVKPINPSSQWFSNARYDYTQSGAFLDIGSGYPIDDLVESGTIRLLDCNDSMTDIQLDMRFVDKVQAVSAFVSTLSVWGVSTGF
ncbi:hypothetical protein M9H77_11864 [Catharanthus roseus]|uniref:Uncharacterized protein n=1 Tax=Catharanthus roseus TaxID=4058 RepID=A0ACC0BFU0_CATRO|nr:hypothetical protein M9H77_11864 [Catharanthus roseus]